MAEKLAIVGGDRIVPEDFIKPWPYLTEDDREAVQAVLATERITEQQRIQAEGLAQEWAKYMGVIFDTISSNYFNSFPSETGCLSQ